MVFKKLSARMIGEEIGKSPKEVNKALKKKGLLKGDPGNWSLTKEGEKYGEIRNKDNGYGGYAKREWKFAMWDKEVVDKIKD